MTTNLTIGTTIWRVLMPLPAAAHNPEITSTTTWWHGPVGHVYFSPIDNTLETPEKDRLLEIAARRVEDPKTATGKKFSWGVPATNERVESHSTICPQTQLLLPHLKTLGN